jgi:hypothetical protein
MVLTILLNLVECMNQISLSSLDTREVTEITDANAGAREGEGNNSGGNLSSGSAGWATSPSESAVPQERK